MKQPPIVQTPGEPAPRTLRFLFNLGHILLIILLGTWALFYYYIGKPYDKTFITAVLQLFGGRAIGVGFGFDQGFSPTFMFFQVALVDFILMLYIYPTFVRGYQHLTLVPIIGRYLSNIHETALSHKKRMARYGATGLIVFVIFPFWSTGAVVGAVVGYLIGLPTWLSLTSVTVGNLFAISAWILFYDRLSNWNEEAAHITLGIIVAIIVIGFIAARIRSAFTPKIDATDKKLEETPPSDSDVQNEE